MIQGYRSARIAPFKAAGFRTVAVVCVCEEGVLLRRQHDAFEKDNKLIPHEAVAELRGESHATTKGGSEGAVGHTALAFGKG